MNSGTAVMRLACLAAGVAVVFSACSQAPEDQSQSGQPGQVGGSGQSSQTAFSIGGFQFKPPQEEPEPTAPTMKNLLGEPQRFPQRYPVVQYPNSRVMLAKVHSGLGGGRRHMVLLESTDSIERIAAYYKRKLVDEGWKFVSAFENSAYSSTKWEKGEREAEVVVCTAPNEREQLIQLFIGARKSR